MNIRRKLLNKFIFLILGALSAVKLNLFGQIYFGELICLFIVIPILFFRKINSQEVFLLVVCIIWFLLQLISDFLNNTLLSDSIKGITTPLVFLSTVLVHYYYFRKNIVYSKYYLFGFFVLNFLNIMLFPNEHQIINFWKFGVGFVVLNMILLFFNNENSKIQNFYVFLSLIIFMLVSFALDSRSIAMLPFFALLVYFFSKHKKISYLNHYPLIKLAIPIFVIVISINFLANIIFSSNLINGLLPIEAENKFKAQATSDVGLLLAGRSEMLISIKAILDSPILGHGSWARDITGYYNNEYNYIRYKAGIVENFNQVDRDFIPSHSFIFGAGVWYGIGGIILWFYLINNLLKDYFKYIIYLPIYFHVGIVIFVWNCFFSPFGAENRINTALFCSFFLAYIFSIKRIFSLKTKDTNG